MKVRCAKCKAEMRFPFYKCDSCGWETKGKYREMSDKFAEKYIKVNGNNPELKAKLSLARKGMTEDDLEWESEGDEPIVKCPLCSHEMVFPYIECWSCKWVARKKMRGRARDFAEDHIDSNPEREEMLRIIWEEENLRLKHRGQKKRVKGIIEPVKSGKNSVLNTIVGVGMVIAFVMLFWVFVTLKYGPTGSAICLLLAIPSILAFIILVIKGSAKKKAGK